MRQAKLVVARSPAIRPLDGTNLRLHPIEREIELENINTRLT